MDHPAPRLAQENPWRNTALVASGVAALELFILVILAFAIVVKPLLSNEPGAAAPAKKAATKATADAPATSAPTKAAAPAKPTKAAPVARTKTKVLILNGNGRSGAASEKAAWVMTKGYPIAATANAPRTNFARSLVMYKPGFEAEAKRFGKDFGVSRVIPLDGLKKTQLEGGVIVLIIGAD